MKRMLKKVSFLILLATLAVLFAGCGAEQNTTAEPASEDAAVVEATQPVVEQAEEQPTESVALVPTPATDYCLECHSDKEAVVALAKPEVKVESESEGVG